MLRRVGQTFGVHQSKVSESYKAGNLSPGNAAFAPPRTSICGEGGGRWNPQGGSGKSAVNTCRPSDDKPESLTQKVCRVMGRPWSVLVKFLFVVTSLFVDGETW